MQSKDLEKEIKECLNLQLHSPIIEQHFKLSVAIAPEFQAQLTIDPCKESLIQMENNIWPNQVGGAANNFVICVAQTEIELVVGHVALVTSISYQRAQSTFIPGGTYQYGITRYLCTLWASYAFKTIIQKLILC